MYLDPPLGGLRLRTQARTRDKTEGHKAALQEAQAKQQAAEAAVRAKQQVSRAAAQGADSSTQVLRLQGAMRKQQAREVELKAAAKQERAGLQDKLASAERAVACCVAKHTGGFMRTRAYTCTQTSGAKRACTLRTLLSNLQQLLAAVRLTCTPAWPQWVR